MLAPQILLQEQDCCLLVDALRLAAEIYDEDQQKANEAGIPRLGEQFAQQALHARQLASRIEDSDYVCLR